jgi:hypothetical protein
MNYDELMSLRIIVNYELQHSKGINIFDKESICKLYLTRKARYFLMRASYCYIATTKKIIGSSLQILSRRQIYRRNHETTDIDIFPDKHSSIFCVFENKNKSV